jgi:hypothetical protein
VSSLRINLQVYVEVATVAEGLVEAQALIALIAPHAEVRLCEVKHYWKIAEYQGVWLRLACDQPLVVFAALRSALAEQWADGGSEDEPWAVWAMEMHGPGALPSARWANLEVVPPEE